MTPDTTGLDPETSEDAGSTSLANIEARLRGEEPLPSAMAPRKYQFKNDKELKELRERLKDSLQPLPAEDANNTVVGGSPIYLSRQAREIIARLRKQKDEAEDWSKWSEVVYRIKKNGEAAGKSDAHAEPKKGGKGEGGGEIMTFDDVPEGFCPECHIPLAPDPKPETLFIYLHAWRYTTDNLGEWQTPL